MKIFIDIGHPAHVHYFRNFIKLMIEKGHEFCISARDKEVTFNLLKNYGIPYISRGKGGNGLLGKFLYLFKGDIIIYFTARKFKPDIFLSFASPYAAHAAFLYQKPHITLDDTEAAKFGQFFYKPFTSVILSPACFKKSFGRNHIRFNSYMELCALHTAYFEPDAAILEDLGIKNNEEYILLRFVSWSANHDIGQKGLSSVEKGKLIETLSKKYKLFISSEKPLPNEFKQYNLQTDPAKIHHVLAFAKLYIGEGATMASESAMLGTPAIYINPISSGTIEEQEKSGLIHHFNNSTGVLEKATSLLNDENIRYKYQERRRLMLLQKINPTKFLVWFVETYPISRKMITNDPDYIKDFV